MCTADVGEQYVLVEGRPTTQPRIAGRRADQELQDLVHASDGLNLGLDFLPGALPFDPAVDPGSTRTSRPRSSGSTRSRQIPIGRRETQICSLA